MRFKISLKQAWTALILFAGIVPVTIVAIWYGQQIYQQKLDSALASEFHANEMLRGQIESEIERLKTLVKNRSDALAPLIDQVGDPDALAGMNALLNNIVEQEPAIHEAMVLSTRADVIMVAHPNRKIRGDRLASDAELQLAEAHWQFDNKQGKYPEVTVPSMGRDYVGSPKIHRNSSKTSQGLIETRQGSMVFSVAVPIGKPVKAVLISLVYFDGIWSAIRRNYPGIGTEGSHDYVLDSDGSLVTEIQGGYFKRGQSMTHLDIARPGFVKAKWPADTSYIGIINKPVFGTSTAIPSLNWTLVSEVLVSSITRPIWDILFNIIILTLGGTLLLLWFILYLTNKTIKPIKLACKAIDQVAKGDLQHRLRPSRIEELNILSTGFNTLSQTLEVAERELRYSQNNLANSEARFQGVLESANNGILLVDARGEIVLVNPAICKITGYTEEELVGQPIEILVPEQFTKHIERRQSYDFKSMSLPMDAEVNLNLRRKDGKEIPVDISLSAIETEDGCFFTTTVQDITVLKGAEEKILYQAHFDELTDLPNRFLSLDRLTQLLMEAKRNNKYAAVLFFDVDDFNKINDSLGQETGDRLLKEVGRRLKGVVRGGDTVGRPGGDEFIVLLGSLINAADVHPVVENLIGCFRDAFKIDGRELVMTASVGISVFPGDGEDATELLHNADSAMYYSKGLGGNTYSYFTDKMNQDLSRRLALEEQMHGALERNEFEVYYQPKLDFISGEIMGAEALLRWHNPALGHISPVEFIPISEQTGLIIPLGKFVLTEALKTTAQWHKSFNSGLRMAVNLSPRQFSEPDLVPFIERELKRFNISSEYLEMEITEGMLMSGHSHINDALVALNKIGVGIAMDDFGTGYSSLSYLRNFPFTVLKVDRSFVKDIIEDDADRELVNAAIAMAHSLQLKVVAEGIETEEQHAFLKNIGCDYGQGFLFGKPMTKANFTKMLEVSTRQLIASEAQPTNRAIH